MIKVKFINRENREYSFYGPSFDKEEKLAKWYLEGFCIGSQYSIYIEYADGTFKPIKQVLDYLL